MHNPTLNVYEECPKNNIKYQFNHTRPYENF
uniref:Uncharacterized protein n=1 Tax=Rhizophora mucronata TaxID=61149 RepID=A0A2P2NLP1_RHIMU